jgi:hypothetical protein
MTLLFGIISKILKIFDNSPQLPEGTYIVDVSKSDMD